MDLEGDLKLLILTGGLFKHPLRSNTVQSTSKLFNCIGWGAAAPLRFPDLYPYGEASYALSVLAR